MNLKHIKDVILVNLQDIKRSIEFFVMLTLVLAGAAIGASIAGIIWYKATLFLCWLLGIAI